MKQLPKLTLVTKDDAHGSEDGHGEGAPSVSRFELIGLEDLPLADRALIQRQVSDIFPKASLIAAVRTAREWDLRPVITRSGEAEPSMIRFAGPDVQRNSQLAVRLRESFERLRSLKELSSGLLGWGSWDKNLWCRRALVEQTLAQTLSAEKPLSVEQTLQLARELVEEVVRWHERGVIHGHLTSSNVVMRPNGRIALIDSGIGLCYAQAAHGVTDYDVRSFAPEVLSGQNVMFSSDLYGLGMIYRRLFAALSRNAQAEKRADSHESLLGPLTDLSAALIEADPNRRPPLAQARKTITDALHKFTELERKVRPKGRPGAAPGKLAPQGKIVRPGAIAGARDSFAPDPEPQVSTLQRAPEQDGPVSPAPNPEPVPVEHAAPPVPPIHSVPHSVPHPTPPPVYQAVQTPHGIVYAVPPHAAQGVPVAPIPGAPISGQPMAHQPVYGQPMPYAHTYGVPPQPIYVQQLYPHGEQPSLQPHAAAPGGPAMPQQPAFEKPEQPGLTRWITFFALCLFGFLYYRLHGLPEWMDFNGHADTASFRADWNSKIPSRMEPVAEAAIAKDNPNSAAESVILSSVRNGEAAGASVNVGLLQIAFDDRWEQDLSPEDRRTALALALGNLLKQNFPNDLPALTELHPGVLLALTASIGKAGGKNLLGSVRAEKLMQLPPPFSLAFHELLAAHPDLNCGDENVQRLARLGTRGLDIDDLAFFLRDEIPVRLRALAMMYSQDNARAQTVLEILLKDSNVVINDALITWGKAFHLHDWQGLESSDRLFVLAGIVPAGKISPDNLGKLLAHPVPALRAAAIRGAIAGIHMEHPGALETLQVLERDPQLLRPEQTVDLIKILVKPQAQTKESIEAWLDTNPPLQIVIPLLLSTSGQKQSLLLDSHLAIYLQRKSWKPDITLLRKLSTHPDSYTRIFAYNEIYMMEDKETAKDFLTAAEKREPDADNKKRLQDMLLDLGH